MSANPMKFMGGLVLEIAAVIAVLSLLPAFGSRDPQATSLSQLQSALPNQVFFDAQSARVLDLPASRGVLTSPTSTLEPQVRSTPPAVWASDFSQPRSAPDQRFVEDMLDNTSQRAMDAAARVWDRGEELLPADLRARRQPTQAANEAPRLTPPSHNTPSFGRTPVQNIDRGELIELPSAQRTNDYATSNYSSNNYPASNYRPQPVHPSFADTYQAPQTQALQSQPLTTGVVHPRFSPRPQQPAASYSPPASHYSNANQTAINHGQNYAGTTYSNPAPAAQYAPSLPQRPDLSASQPSYYQRSAAVQTAEPHVRRYDDRY